MAKAKKTVKEDTVESPALSVELMEGLAKLSLETHALDGIAVVAVKDGIIIPYIAAKSVSDVITMDYVLKRETSRVVESSLTSQK